MRRLPLVLVLFASALLGTAPAWAQTARLHVLTDTVQVGERFSVAVAVERGGATEVVFAEPPRGEARVTSPLRAGDAELLAVRRFPPELRGGALVDSAVYEAAVFALGDVSVGPVVLRLVSGGDTTTVSSPAAPLLVASGLIADVGEMAPYEPIRPFPQPLWPILLAVALGLALALLAAWWWRRRRRAPGAARPDLPPAAEARRRLAELETATPSAPEAVHPYYVLLADVLRTYLARRLGVPAREMTSRELLGALRGHDPALPPDAQAALERALGQADRVKFARALPDRTAHAAAVADARAVVEALEAAEPAHAANLHA